MRFIFLITFLFSIGVFASVPEEREQILASATGQSESAKAETANSEVTKESEILLNLDGNKKSANEGNNVFKFLFSMSVLGLLGGGVIFFIKKYSVPKGMKSQTQIKVIQQHYLGPKKSLAIIRVAGESVLIGITDQNITMLKSLALLDEDIPEAVPQSFDQVIKDLGPQRAPKGEQGARLSFAEDGEEFAISGIKDIVTKRLKGMRSIQ